MREAVNEYVATATPSEENGEQTRSENIYIVLDIVASSLYNEHACHVRCRIRRTL
jgi:hypothetical protein